MESKNRTLEETLNYIFEVGEKVSNIEEIVASKLMGNEIEKPITLAAAAEFLEREVPTLYSKVPKGEIPAHKKGRIWYFFKSELVAWIKAGNQLPIDKVENKFLAAQKKGGNKL